MRVIQPPPEALADPEAMEMLRAWIVKGSLQVVLAAWVWKDEPAIWGRLLADTANHLADAIAQETGRRRSDIFAAIRDRLIEDLDDPDPERTGEFSSHTQ
jgi:hypothetical protein